MNFLQSSSNVGISPLNKVNDLAATLSFDGLFKKVEICYHYPQSLIGKQPQVLAYKSCEVGGGGYWQDVTTSVNEGGLVCGESKHLPKSVTLGYGLSAQVSKAMIAFIFLLLITTWLLTVSSPFFSCSLSSKLAYTKVSSIPLS